MTDLESLRATRLTREFYQRDVHALAPDLLGRFLCRWDGHSLRVARIVETEAYGGRPDPASHGDSGVPTERTRPMFGPAGVAYVYVIYGMYDCFNVVSAPEGTAAAVLIRAAEPVVGTEFMARARGVDATKPSGRRNLMSGPGKLCQAMGISRDQHHGLVLDADGLFLAQGTPVEVSAIERTPRIGLNPKTVGDAVNWPWRYIDARSQHLSR